MSLTQHIHKSWSMSDLYNHSTRDFYGLRAILPKKMMEQNSVHQQIMVYERSL
ncbi:hypothetical protein D051_0630 [Vibrio parahaemolyticus VPCR-2010]|nr:hypothetical protein D051_0630 [Vibrio parahaemolyticus VPCR-2010]